MGEGYGPTIKAMETLTNQGVDIVVIADCGTTSFDVLEQAAGLGLETIVLDHHEAETKLPVARHIINPKRQDDQSGLTMLAACGVAFVFCVAVNAKLRAKMFFQNNGKGEAPLKDWLDIVALGTVCDMVPLVGVNRLFVRAGFARMAKMENPGLKALCAVARLENAPTPYDAGFVIGPRINSGSRVHKADLGARLLCSDDAEEVKNIAFTLEDCNAKRKGLQESMMNQAIAMVEAQGLDNAPVIIVDHKDWHPGLAGLVAGRLKEKYNKPAIVVTYTPGMRGTLEGRGSGRSVEGVNLGAAFIAARHQGLLLKGGGHAMAAGFSLDPERLTDFSLFLKDHIEQQMQGMALSCDLPIDGLLTVRGATLDLAHLLIDRIGPFGADQAEPVFAFANVRVHFPQIVGSDHVKCQIADWEGGPRLKAVAFRMADTAMGRALLTATPATNFHIIGGLKINVWQGRETVELHITDAAVVQADKAVSQAV
jgi:single-stranded-DNA-specific exonuclease